MSYLVYTGETIEALVLSQHPRAAEFERRFFELNREAAEALGAHLGVVAIPSDQPKIFDASFDAVYAPAFEGQAIPEVLEGYDDEDQWGQ